MFEVAAKIYEGDIQIAILVGFSTAVLMMSFIFHRLTRPWYPIRCKCNPNEARIQIISVDTKSGVIFAKCKNCQTNLVPDWRTA